MVDNNKSVYSELETLDSSTINNKVQFLRDRPNEAGGYGEAKLSASDLKKWFDAYPEQILIKLNDLIKKLSGTNVAGDGGRYIKLGGLDYKEGETTKYYGNCISDVIAMFRNGTWTKMFEVSPANATGNERVSVQAFLNGLITSISALQEKGSVTTDKIADNAVATVYDDAGKVVSTKIAEDAVYEGAIKDGAVTESKLGAGAVTYEKLSSVVQERITGAFKEVSYDLKTGDLTFTDNTGQPTTVELPLERLVKGGRYDKNSQTIVLTLDAGEPLEISLSDIVDKIIDSVGTDNIQNGAVTTDKLAGEAVTEDKIADNAVATNYDADGNVANSKIKKDAVYTDAIRNLAVTQDKIAYDTISVDHLEEPVRGALLKSFSDVSYDKPAGALNFKNNDNKDVTVYLPTTDELEKRVETLEGLTLAKITDDTVAYEKVVPADVGTRAAINKVGGMSYRLGNNNLCSGDKVYTLNGESSYHVVLATLDIGEYYLSFERDLSGMGEMRLTGGSLSAPDLIYDESMIFTVRGNGTEVLLDIDSDAIMGGTEYLNGTIKNFMLCKTEDEDKEYKPYQPPILVSVKPTSIESRGKNLAYKQYGTSSYGGSVTETLIVPDVEGNCCTSLIPVIGGKKYTLTKSIANIESNFRWFWFDKEPVINETHAIAGTYLPSVLNSTTTAPANAKYLYVLWTRNESKYPCGNVQIELGDTSTGYKPYSAEPIDTFELPEAVKSLDGWGLGIDAEYNNHIEWRNGRVFYIQMLGEFDFANVGEWKRNGTYRYFYTTPTLSPVMKDLDFKLFGRSEVPIGLSSKYEMVSINTSITSDNDKVICYGTTDTKYINVRDSAYTDVETFKEAMKGVKLVYALETPIETDITEYFPSYKKYFYIDVEPGGTLEFVNKHSKDVPSTVTYVKKL